MQTGREVTLAVLAGGEGRRMGQAKGLLRVNGNAILDDLFVRLNWPGPAFLVTAPGRERPISNLRYAREVVDPVSGLGPLRGVLTALEHLKTELIVLVTVDMPGVSRPQLDWLIEAFEGRRNLLGMMTSRRMGEELIVEPFPSVYRIDAKKPIESELAMGKRSMHGLLDDPRFAFLPAPAQWSEQEMWVNLNTPADLENYEAFRRRHPKPGD